MHSGELRALRYARSWHAAVAAIIAAALVIQLVLVLMADGDTVSYRVGNYVSYFTVQSNILLCAVSALLAIRPSGRDGAIWPVARLDSLICMTVTGVVFITALRGLEELVGLRVLTDAVFHYFAPLAAVVGWVLFGPRPAISRRTLALALIFPLAWAAYTLVRGEIVGWHPYPFIDVAELGYARVAVNIAGVAALFLAIGAAYLLADRRLPLAPHERSIVGP